jgi:hypothetical protein
VGSLRSPGTDAKSVAASTISHEEDAVRLRILGAAVMAAAALTATAFTPATAEGTAPNAAATGHLGYRAMSPFPPIGAEIPTSLLAINSPLSY